MSDLEFSIQSDPTCPTNQIQLYVGLDQCQSGPIKQEIKGGANMGNWQHTIYQLEIFKNFIFFNKLTK